jgi:hypothetical protein
MRVSLLPRVEVMAANAGLHRLFFAGAGFRPEELKDSTMYQRIPYIQLIESFLILPNTVFGRE